ncbi:hypothetical protein LTR37_019172 [Vermiconidia calcicola]|uniref:Uncharacterized protein n=1 Tax=Vermiconidia calcicola TaxID=1690605 RepID=A0ACC3MEV1_9PEZI|nr:hypothetical protein LTR37_019172 [Vermiconidia calcicola]
MRRSILSSLVLLGTALANGCHDSDDDIGATCALNPARSDGGNAFLDAAGLYCHMFELPFTVPKGSSSSNIYQMKIADVADGWGDTQIFWGNYKVENGDDTHLITMEECNGYMNQIMTQCPDGHGGWVDTDFGTVFGECIRK